VTEALRLAFGTLTVLPVRPPGVLDRRTAGRAMALAPLVGLVLALICVALLAATVSGPPLLRASLCSGLLALLTRGMHLDGLADTADGLGSGRAPQEALDLMRRGDVGPFGVVALVLVLLLQVSALDSLVSQGQASAALVAALVTSRAALPLLCSRSFPAARPDGLGSAVARTAGRGPLLCAAVLTVVCLAGAGFGYAYSVRPWSSIAGLVIGVVASLLSAALLGGHCVRRLGGITGDVLGAGVEVSFTVCLVVLSLAG
jgi:adenosylcobinamide-GDP ribazoletransferase